MIGALNKHIISILLDNEAGVLSRVAGLFSARGYNIESLTVAATDDPTMSRMTIVTFGADNLALQIQQQLNKLVDVIKVVDLSEREHIEQEMLLVKMEYPGDKQFHEQVARFAREHHAEVVEQADGICIIRLMASSRAVGAFVEVLKRWRILEIVRSGVISLERGGTSLRV